MRPLHPLLLRCFRPLLPSVGGWRSEISDCISRFPLDLPRVFLPCSLLCSSEFSWELYLGSAQFRSKVSNECSCSSCCIFFPISSFIGFLKRKENFQFFWDLYVFLRIFPRGEQLFLNVTAAIKPVYSVTVNCLQNSNRPFPKEDFNATLTKNSNCSSC